MRTSDFSAAPPLARATTMVTVTAPRPRSLPGLWAMAGRSPGMIRRAWLVQRLRPTGVIVWFRNGADAEAFRSMVGHDPAPTVQVHRARAHGYSNGLWRAEDRRMAHIRRFTGLPAERRPPAVAPEPAAGEPALRVVPVRTRADLRRFTSLPRWDVRRRTHDVPLWHRTLAGWAQGEGPHTGHGPVELFLVMDTAGRVRGRTTLHTDDRMDAKLGEPTLLMGATDFADRHALAAMVAHAETEARARGRTRLVGPVSLLPNQVGGVVTDGWDEPGFLDGPWNPEHQPRDWEALGFERIWEGATWRCENVGDLDPREVFPDADLPPGTMLRHGRRRRLAEQLPILHRMLNDAFSELPYYTSIDRAELEAQTDGLAHLLDERLLLWVEDDAGRPLAFVLVVPDLTGFVRSVGGRDTPWNLARLWLTRSRYRRDAVLIVKGTVPDARGRGLMRALSRELLEGLRDGGYRNLSVTFIEDDNAGSQAQFRAMGGRPLHRTCFYTKRLAAAGDPQGEAGRLMERIGDWGRAPSAHNTQPWVVRQEAPDRLSVTWDPQRELRVTDPDRRDLMLGLGALVRSLRVVAAAEGLGLRVQWRVDTERHHAAQIVVDRAPQPSRWTVEDLHRRQTHRGGFEARPDREQVGRIAAVVDGVVTGPAPDHGLFVVPDDLVDALLPTATGHTLSGPGAAELAAWLRPTPRHPRFHLDGLSAPALQLSALEARAIVRLARMAPVRRVMAAGGLDRRLAASSAAEPRGTVVALWAEPGLAPEQVAVLGETLMGAWLEGQTEGWSSHPLSEVLDHTGTARALNQRLTTELGHPVQAYALWRWGRPTTAAPRSPRLHERPDRPN